MKRLPRHVTLIFDGACGFCTRSVRLLQSLDRDHRVTAVPYQNPGIPEAHGLSYAQCEAAIWAITPEGGRYSGAAAVNAALTVALGTRLPLWFYAVPGVGGLQNLAYSLVASNRRRLPGDAPYCRQHPEGCR
ncbi:MAG: thiol-disulfide oxidoreductase DCC family protein [Rubrobacter sp.]